MLKFIAFVLIFVCVVHSSCGQDMTFHKSDPLMGNKKVPSSAGRSGNQTEGQKDLLIVFDATGSMQTDLEQLRSAAIEIINELSRKEEDPINNFVLSVFRDPDVNEVFVTTDPHELIIELNGILVDGGGDCPELAMLGLKQALEVAAPNSIAFLFSDASAKDHDLYDDVIQIVLKKQIRVYFLLTGDCGTTNSPDFKVYDRIAGASDGQVFNMQNFQVKDVLVGLSFMLDTNYEPLKSIDFEHPGRNIVKVNVDGSFGILLISGTGRYLQLSILDSKNKTISVTKSVSLSDIKIITFETIDSEYFIDASADSAYSVKIGGFSDMSIDYGFSLKPTVNINETQRLPIADSKNILTVFVSNTKNLKCLRRVTLVSALNATQSISVPLKKSKCGVFATVLFDVPEEMFKIKVYGKDRDNNVIDRIISTGIEVNRNDCAECDYDY